LFIGILIFVCFMVVAMILPGFLTARLKAREAEVKSNIHAIQIALERYGVDTGGCYPYMLYGGDITDTFVHPNAPINPDTGVSYYYPPDDPSYKPFPGDYDALIVYGYLAQYPENPFSNQLKTHGDLRTHPADNGFGPLELTLSRNEMTRTNVWGYPIDRGTQYVSRMVGGQNDNLMWDISEGQRHPPWPIMVVPDPETHWTGFINPLYGPAESAKIGNYRDDHLFWLMPGNFYYYAIFEENAGYSSFKAGLDGNPDPSSPQIGPVIYYQLAGYGECENPGDDVYNLWGDTWEGSLRTQNDEDWTWIEEKEEPRHDYSNPDGRRDGVIILINGGLSVDWGLPAPHYFYPGSTPPVDLIEDENAVF